MIRFATMGDVQKTGYSLPLIYLTSDNEVNRNYTTPCIDLTESDDRGTNHSPDIFDLTDDDNQHVTSSIPVIDLTGDDDHFLNYRIPVIDLTDDDVQDITNQTQCIDLTYNDASSNNDTIQNFNVGETDDRGTNCSTKRIDLTFDGIQDFNPSTSVTDLTCADDQFLNFRIRCTDTINDVQNIIHHLQNFDLTDGKQQSRNDCISTVDLKNHSTDRIIPITDLIIEKDGNNDSRQIIDSIRNGGRVIRKLAGDDENRFDLSCNNSHTSFQNGVIENNLRIPAASLSYIATEMNFFKNNESANMNSIPTDTFSTQEFHCRKGNVANHPLKNFECRTETSLINHPLRKYCEEKLEMNLTNHPLRKNFKDRKETIGTNPLTNNSEEKHSSRWKSEKISQENADFMKPARHPIPLRHSLGRSTVNMSKNVPIEFTDDSEDESRILTVSSIIRRKKSKSVSDISKTDLPESKELSASSESTFPFDILKRIFQKFWILLLLTFIGLYFWL